MTTLRQSGARFVRAGQRTVTLPAGRQVLGVERDDLGTRLARGSWRIEIDGSGPPAVVSLRLR